MTPRTLSVLALGGDGIGPELVEEGVRLLEHVCTDNEIAVSIQRDLLHGQCYEIHGTFCRDETVESAKKVDAVLVGAVGAPQYDGLFPGAEPTVRDGLMRLRKELDLFAGIRPVRSYDSVRDSAPFREPVIRGCNIVVLRELTGGTFFSEPRGIETGTAGRIAVDTTRYSEFEIERHLRIGFQLAQRRSRRLVSVDKANVMETGVLWREISHEVAADFPDVEFGTMYADNCAYQLAVAPQQFDVVVTDNLFGDILSDQAASIAGSLGMLPSASLPLLAPEGEVTRPGIYEPVHGSAPDLVGTGSANPVAMILSVAMLLEFAAGRPDAAKEIETAVEASLKAGVRTPDLGGTANMSEVVDDVIGRWSNQRVSADG
ncbi:MAG TPA: 3-isopropylmalate dehydrogenase [Acidimicrobiales bacterium]|jgi:3-isopropylmalate dehydrogenase|nr:3-isopropylmalate dehydrogenase [Acidimicrobiales bacterium]|tara:strand:+ start:389 stop:1510 length:1122 start_codon:yes stop_codon:yes gene_type:complete